MNGAELQFLLDDDNDMELINFSNMNKRCPINNAEHDYRSHLHHSDNKNNYRNDSHRVVSRYEMSKNCDSRSSYLHKSIKIAKYKKPSRSTTLLVYVWNSIMKFIKPRIVYCPLAQHPQYDTMNVFPSGEEKNSGMSSWRLSSLPKDAFFRPNGIHWITAALFIVADMAGGGVVAMPIAMLKSGSIIGSIVIVIVGSAFCYTAHLLSENWIFMCRRWPSKYGGSNSSLSDYAYNNRVVKDGYDGFAHCRKPYPEMALRSMGERAQTFTSCCLNIMLYGVSIVYLLLAAKIFSDFAATALAVQIGQCKMLLMVALAFLPVTLLRSPQDFWWAVLTAMLTTAIAVVLILVGTLLDAPLCAPRANRPEHFRPNEFLLSLGIFMFAFGGHGVFPTIQHDMKRPQQFTSSAILAFIIVSAMYIPITLLGYAVYGDSLQDSIIDSIQFPAIQIAANLCIAVHCILTLTIVINPLNQQVEHVLRAPHHFGWRRVIIRSGVMAVIVFSAETVPSFGPILNLIGGSLVALTSAILPCLFNMFMGARYRDNDYTMDKKFELEFSKENEPNEPPVPSIKKVMRSTPTITLTLNTLIIVLAIICGIITTWSALLDLISSTFSMPCYLASNSFLATKNQPILCCGSEKNVHRLLTWNANATDFCSTTTLIAN